MRTNACFLTMSKKVQNRAWDLGLTLEMWEFRD